LIQTTESRKRLRTRHKVESVEEIVLPRICAYFLSDDLPLLPYVGWSSLSFIVLFTCLLLNKELLFPVEPDRTKQAIDIEFVSPTDFRNRNDLLPSTQPKPSLGKRMSPAKETFVASAAVSLKQTDLQQSKPQYREFKYTINCQPSTSMDPLNSLARTPSKLKSKMEQPAVKPKESLSPQMELEEVAPFAMTEVKDNEGDNSLEVWQNGGRSDEGFGAPSSLANYLKELHKKLKHTWSPPPGPAHHIKVLFRLSSDGCVISIKLISSSGDTDADNSALEAVNKASPFGKFPKDYPNRYLDLAYTFNYSADELNEVASPKE
jgi:TonB family protein